MISLAYSSQTNARVCMEKLYVMKQSYQLKKDCLTTDTDSMNCNDLKYMYVYIQFGEGINMILIQ